MRIGFVSDIHIDQIPLEGTEVLKLFGYWIKKNNLSHFVIGGDICQGQFKIVGFRQDKNVGFWQFNCR
ncbi:Uncharacterised protein [Alloiococcus otitis]|uniref:Calcineurin-like phosphoesterase domain-containing protein n=1 Tax=Alloiococcus otitis ATCC 51267 TaxID=883081 RepID=K9EAA6_9LACT|nr:hypothetical protein [Alloiococcus otitis]EKU94169.1 hypothetical protein HMPREF9698_00201 [Alloiococcus otitis ATCC 51267]SUU81198.1 Uncharacterised protein [Alloiococcus otitis]